MRTIRRRGTYNRVCDPGWDDPLDGSWSMRHGGRWNGPATYPVTYLNKTIDVARANAQRLLRDKLVGLPIGVDDLDPDELPDLAETMVPATTHLDVVTDAGCIDAGLPATYPETPDGEMVPWTKCQPIGAAAWSDGLDGLAARSAAAPGEELAWFDRPHRRLVLGTRRRFTEWYGPIDF